MNWEKLKASYPYCHDAIKKFADDNNLNVQMDLSPGYVIAKFLKSEGYNCSSLYVYDLREHENKLRLADNSRLKGLPRSIQIDDLINGRNDLNIGHTYRIKKSGGNRLVKGVYLGELKDFIHTFKTSEGNRLVVQCNIPTRVFKTKDNE